VNDGNSSSTADTVSINVVAAPPDPAGFGVSYTSATDVKLMWASGGGSTAGYVLAYTAGATPPATCFNGTVVNAGDIEGNAFEITGLTEGAWYAARICAINALATPQMSSGIV